MPLVEEFAPQSGCGEVLLAVDEYEAIRLIDHMGLTQEQCAMQMDVARTTVQAIYDSARKKLADALINGKRLVIKSGSYAVCAHSPECCAKKHCGTGKLCCKQK